MLGGEKHAGSNLISSMLNSTLGVLLIPQEQIPPGMKDFLELSEANTNHMTKKMDTHISFCPCALHAAEHKGGIIIERVISETIIMVAVQA